MSKEKQLRILFYGTPEFAATSLKALIDNGFKVIGVVTAPDKPAKRGQQLNFSDVKKVALEYNLSLFQPEKLKSPDFLSQLEDLKADLQIVVAFRMLPVAVWNHPPMGTVNLHASLLPQYRGAAPINWAIINGETETGITTFKLKHEIDTGDILLQEKMLILPEDNIGTLYDKMQKKGAELLIKTVEGIANGTLNEMPQSGFNLNQMKHAPKIFKEHCNINFHQKGIAIVNLIRGLSPYPCAFTKLKDKTLKIFHAHAVTENPIHEIGTIDTDHKTYLRFSCVEGWLYADEVQLEGKKRMKIEDFLRGFRI